MPELTEQAFAFLGLRVWSVRSLVCWHLLGGSWVGISRVVSPLIWVITLVNLLIYPIGSYP